MRRSQGVAFLLAAVMLVSGFSSISSAVDRKVLKAEVQSILNTIEANYGPLVFKVRTMGVDWSKTKTKYLNQVDHVQTEREYFLLLSKLLRELKDAHVSVSLPSTFEKTMPIQFTVVEGKTIVNWVGVDGIKQCSAAEVGDELIKFDGQTPEQLRAELAQVSSVGNARTDLVYLTAIFTSRKETKGQFISYDKNQVTPIELKSHKTGALVACNMKWTQKGLPIIDREFKDSPAESLQPWSQNLQIGRDDDEAVRMSKILSTLHGLMSMDSSDLMIGGGPFGMKPTPPAARPEKGQHIELGSQKPFFKLPLAFISIQPPALLNAIFALTGAGLNAGYMNYKGKRIGILRIPSYMAKQVQFAPLELRYYIGMLEKNTDALIIDQSFNPGGIAQYADWVVGAFTNGIDRSKHMTFAVKPTQGFLRVYAQLIDTLQTEPMIPPELRDKYIPRLKESFDKVYAAYKSGANLSEPIELSVTSDFIEEVLDVTLWARLRGAIPGNEKFKQFAINHLIGVDLTKRQVYTKPVSMLINEWDFSGGDATPAILQDYGRVKILGTNTAGAGGTVEAFQNRFANSFDFRLTTSLMVRRDGGMVENYGVRPDVSMEVTMQDYLDGFSNFAYKMLDYVVQTPGGIIPPR